MPCVPPALLLAILALVLNISPSEVLLPGPQDPEPGPSSAPCPPPGSSSAPCPPPGPSSATCPPPGPSSAQDPDPIPTQSDTAPNGGGICWSTMVRDGRCTELLNESTSREECCASKGVATAWSPEDLDAGTLFFWRVLGGGVPCHPCKETCKDVQCGAGKKCVVRKGLPKCICFPHCRGNKGAYRGPVCGTDGRTYRSVCKLRKRACRKNNASLAVAYHGICQSSCDRIHCPAGKFCLLDQNLSPHCVRCSRRCSSHGPPSRPVCGVDHRTYPSACHLRQAACRRGKAIPIAYKGKCIPSAKCELIHCSLGQRCLRQPRTDQPRCVTCSSLPCPDRDDRHMVELCGSNNRTYSSWCHMVKDACATGYVIDTQAPGNCPSGDQRALLANTVLEGSLS